MRKIFASFVFLALSVGVVSLAHGNHVNVGEPIGAFLICKTLESTHRAMKYLIQQPTPTLMAEYQALINDADFPCIDTRSVGIAHLPVTPVEKVPGYELKNDKGVFTLWKVMLNGNIRYTYEGDKTTEA